MSNLRLPRKTEVALKCFTVLKYFSFRIFEQLALALKTGFALNSLYWIYIFYHSGFLSNLRLPWKTWDALISFTALKYFYHSGFLSSLRLPWKQSLPWIHCIEYIFFIIQDFWATFVCPEIFQDGGAAAPPPRTPMILTNRFEKVAMDIMTWCGQDYLVAVDYYSKYPEFCPYKTKQQKLLLNMRRAFAPVMVYQWRSSQTTCRFEARKFSTSPRHGA